jgi:4-azaleucine resistance transporter AzlC
VQNEQSSADAFREGSGAVLHFDGRGALTGFRASLPLALSVFAYGLAFGVLSRQAGMSTAESLLMSALVFAGSSQFAALGMWGVPLPVMALVLTTLVVNLRHILMGVAIAPQLAGLPAWARYLSAFFISDESWALTMGQFARGARNAAFLLGSGLALLLAWLGATLTGQLAATAVPNPAAWGLDFAFSAVFLALLAGLWKGKRDLLPWGVAAAVALLAARLLPGTWYILLGGLAGSLAGGLRDAGRR